MELPEDIDICEWTLELFVLVFFMLSNHKVQLSIIIEHDKVWTCGISVVFSEVCLLGC